MIFFFGNSSAKSTFKFLAQNNSPANYMYCARNSSLGPTHTYIGSKDAGESPASFEPIYLPHLLSLFSRQSDLNSNYARNSPRGSPLYQIRGQNHHRNRRVLYILVVHTSYIHHHTYMAVCARECESESEK